MRDVLINKPIPIKNFEGAPIKFHRVGSEETLIAKEDMVKIKDSAD